MTRKVFNKQMKSLGFENIDDTRIWSYPDINFFRLFLKRSNSGKNLMLVIQKSSPYGSQEIRPRRTSNQIDEILSECTDKKLISIIADNCENKELEREMKLKLLMDS